jgi:NAD-dependent dihydropyrimidine dehydrogenase PreA subunit
MVDIKIDAEKCTGCGTCVDTCPMSLYAMNKGKATVKNKDECVVCRAYESACPSSAIEVSE